MSQELPIKIVGAGSSATEDTEKVLPLLSLEGAIIVECVDVQNNLPYSELTSGYFDHSMRGVADPNSALDRIYGRYKSSSPDLSLDDVRAKGVGYTLLNFVKEVGDGEIEL